MTDMHILFSVAVKLRGRAKAWFYHVLNLDTGEKRDREKLKLELDFQLKEDEDFRDWPNFEFLLDKRELFFFSQDYGDLNQVSALLRAYLKRFDPKRILVFTWVAICSKPSPGEFGGGWIIITADEIFSGTVRDAAEEMLSKAGLQVDWSKIKPPWLTIDILPQDTEINNVQKKEDKQDD